MTAVGTSSLSILVMVACIIPQWLLNDIMEPCHLDILLLYYNMYYACN